MPRGAIKLHDVARRARVSPATVSRAFNRPALVDAETLRRVHTAVAELGYVPHGAARALASRRSRSIGAVVPTLHNSIFANCIHALQQRLFDAGYTLLVSTHDYDLTAEKQIVHTLVERGIDGLFLVGTEHEESLFRFLLARRTPYVLGWCVDRSGRHPSVGFDNFTAGKRLAQYLMEAGHRNIAVIAGVTRGNDRARDRLEGVRAALAEHGIKLPARRVVERPYTLTAGREALQAVLGQGRDRATAVICGNDVLALGALAACTDAGISVPRDLSITGFDDLEISTLIHPHLTTVHVPSRQIGVFAAEHLLDRIAGQPVAPQRELPAELMVRDTTAAARQGRSGPTLKRTSGR
jgi:LacI family transcriptional regulator